MAPGAGGAADQIDQRIACHQGVGCGAGMTIGTGAVELARCNAGEPDTRPLFAPYRPVAVPHGFRGAGERLAGRHDCGCEKKKKCRHSNFLLDPLIHSIAVASRRGERARSQTPDNALGVEGSGMSQSLQL